MTQEQLKVLASVLFSMKSSVDAALGMVLEHIEPDPAKGRKPNEAAEDVLTELGRRMNAPEKVVRTFGQRSYPLPAAAPTATDQSATPDRSKT